MSIAGPILFALVGLALGTVLWLVSRALASGELPAVQARCPYCPGTFPGSVWIPLIGARNRCTNCRRMMSEARWVFELGMAASFAIAAVRIDSALTLIEFAIFTIPLGLILLTDIWTGAVYRNLVLFGTALALIVAAIRGLDTLGDAFKGVVAGIVIFGAMMLLMRKMLPSVHLAPIGGGDVLIGGMIGAMAHWPAALFTYFAGIGLAVIGVAIVLSAQRADRATVVPFGPFLCTAAIAVFALTF